MILPQTYLDSKVALRRLERAGRILWIVYNIGSRTPACWFSTAIGTSTITRAINQSISLIIAALSLCRLPCEAGYIS